MPYLRRILKENLGLSLLFLVAFYLVYGTANLISSWRGAQEVPALSIEAEMPFVPEFSIFYLSLYPLMYFALFLFPTREQLLPLFRVFCLELLIAGVIFVVFPTQFSAAISPPREGIASYLFWIADTLNLEYNAFPSLHVAFACSIADLYSRKLPLFSSSVVGVWVLGIVCSTVVLHQHRLLDVLGGVVLALLCGWIERQRVDRSIASRDRCQAMPDQ